MSSYTDEGSIQEDDNRYREGSAIKEHNKYLEDINSYAIIVRPDRFIFQSCNKVKNFDKLVNLFNKF